MKFKEFKNGRKFVGLIPSGKDLLPTMKKFAKDNNIKSGTFNMIGAVRSATIGFYDPRTQEYFEIELKKHFEIISCIGNISQRDGETVIHAHICLSDEHGRTYSGHVLSVTEVFAAEVVVDELVGETELIRDIDPETGLPLWKFD